MARKLVIKDAKEEREALAELLAGVPLQVPGATNGKVALQLLRDQPVDLVIAGMILPEMAGVETIMALREKHPDVKIVMMPGGGFTGFDKHLNRARNLRLQTFPTKPFAPDEMLGVTRNLFPPR